MKFIYLFLFAISSIASLSAQSIADQMKELGVFNEKMVFTWIDSKELDDSSPFVTIDWQRKAKKYKSIDPSKVQRIEKVEDGLAKHLYGDDAKNGAYRLIIDEKTNKDAYFKMLTHPAYHTSCSLLADKKSREKCTQEYLEDLLSPLIGEQEKFVLEIAIDRNGKVTEFQIREGQSNPALDKLFEDWKKLDFDWYPGIQKDYFVNMYLYYKHQK